MVYCAAWKTVTALEAPSTHNTDHPFPLPFSWPIVVTALCFVVSDHLQSLNSHPMKACLELGETITHPPLFLLPKIQPSTLHFTLPLMTSQIRILRTIINSFDCRFLFRILKKIIFFSSQINFVPSFSEKEIQYLVQSPKVYFYFRNIFWNQCLYSTVYSYLESGALMYVEQERVCSTLLLGVSIALS